MIDAIFNPTVAGTPTTKVDVSLGSKIWMDRNYTISNMTDGTWAMTWLKSMASHPVEKVAVGPVYMHFSHVPAQHPQWNGFSFS